MKEAAKDAMKNRYAIEESEVCSCYHCCKTFSKLDITKWTDQGETAICPFCNVDAVLTQVHDYQEPLEEIQSHWFGINVHE
jgi:hypothetical protein